MWGLHGDGKIFNSSNCLSSTAAWSFIWAIKNIKPSILCLFFVVISLLPLTKNQIVPKDIRAEYHFRFNTSVFIDEIDQWKFMKENSRRWRYVGEALKSNSAQGDSLIEGIIGNIAYFSDLYIYVRLVLCSKLSSKFQ